MAFACGRLSPEPETTNTSHSRRWHGGELKWVDRLLPLIVMEGVLRILVDGLLELFALPHFLRDDLLLWLARVREGEELDALHDRGLIIFGAIRGGFRQIPSFSRTCHDMSRLQREGRSSWHDGHCIGGWARWRYGGDDHHPDATPGQSPAYRCQISATSPWSNRRPLFLAPDTVDMSKKAACSWVGSWIAVWLFLDLKFRDHAFLDYAFLDHAFLDCAFLDQSFLDQSFCDNAFFDHAFCDRAFLDRAFLDCAFMDRAFRRPLAPS